MPKTLRRQDLDGGNVIVRLKKLSDGSYVVTQEEDGREGRVDDPFRADSFQQAVMRFNDDVSLIRRGIQAKNRRGSGRSGGMVDNLFSGIL